MLRCLVIATAVDPPLALSWQSGDGRVPRHLAAGFALPAGENRTGREKTPQRRGVLVSRTNTIFTHTNHPEVGNGVLLYVVVNL